MITFDQYKKLANGRRILKIVIDEMDIFKPKDTSRGHRDLISKMFFEEHGMEVTQWHNKYHGTDTIHEYGLHYRRVDSEINIAIEVYGIENLNLKQVEVLDAGNTENKIEAGSEPGSNDQDRAGCDSDVNGDQGSESSGLIFPSPSFGSNREGTD